MGIGNGASFITSPKPINTPSATACRRNEQEHKAVESGEFASVQHWKEPSWEMGEEIGDRHCSRKHKGHRSREQSDNEQNSADQLNQTRRTTHGKWINTTHF